MREGRVASSDLVTRPDSSLLRCSELRGQVQDPPAPIFDPIPVKDMQSASAISALGQPNLRLPFQRRLGHARLQGRKPGSKEVLECLVEKKQPWNEDDDDIPRPSEENPLGIQSQLECVTNELLASVPGCVGVRPFAGIHDVVPAPRQEHGIEL